MIALLEARHAGLLRRENWLPNIMAGVIVGVVALPLAMAFAIASGAKPEQGLYTAIIAGLLISVCGGSRVQIGGPTGAFIVILAGVTARYGIDGLQIATIMAGVILLVLGLAKLGGIIKYIPSPVTIGFTAGIGVIIWVSQWQDFFGLRDVAVADHFHQKVWHLLQALPHLHPATTCLALLALLAVIVSPHVLRRIPGPLVAMVLVTVVQAVFQFDGVATIGSAFGGIPRELPRFAMPDVTLARVIELIGPAFAIAMLGAIESLLSAVVADGMAGTKHDSNQELVGQGIANLVAPLFGGFAATGAIARTATNVRNGGNSPLAGMVHAATLLLIMLLFAPYAAYIPLAALAAVLFVVAYNMSEMRHFFDMVKSAPRNDVVVLLITFTLTVFADLVIAVNVGVILASLLFMKRMSESVQVRELTEREAEVDLTATTRFMITPGVQVYSIDGPFFFGAAEAFENTMETLHESVKVLVIRLNRVPFIDVTAMHALRETIKLFQKRGTRIILCEANERVKFKLEQAGILELLGKGNLFADLPAAMRSAGKVNAA